METNRNVVVVFNLNYLGNPSTFSADLRQKVKSLCDMGIQPVIR